MSGIPKEPPRRQQLGFLYLPPYRVQGLSTAGEETCVQIPELDVCFDLGRCPRAALTSNFVALSHGHMDHSAGIAYYFSQRWFQGMGVGTLICPKQLETPIHNLMRAWIDIEAQRTPYNLIGFEPEQEHEIKPKHFIRGFEVAHTVPTLGYIIFERRSKLKPGLVGLPQEELVKRKQAGEEITVTSEVPLICYTGDTKWGRHFDRDDVLDAKILICECTFMEPSHRPRADVGKHMHLGDVTALIKRARSEAIVLVHLSRRTHMGQARKQLELAIPEEHRDRVFVLMDGRTNRTRYEQQVAQAAAAATDSEVEKPNDEEE